MVDSSNPRGMYIALISIHGLIRGENPELGRDADTGGQVKYVLDFARALSKHPNASRVDLFTRLIEDVKVDADYAVPVEQIADQTFIVRLPCGPKRYLRKENLWNYLDEFADNMLNRISERKEEPGIIHGHYADAGFVGAHLAGLLGIPFIFTGHSLGRVKEEKLLNKGVTRETLEDVYKISQRIEAEEIALENAAFVVTSTAQEAEKQYKKYGSSPRTRMVTIPPGIDLDQFYPYKPRERKPPIYRELARFFRQPDKPMVLCVARPDERKNFPGLIQAYGENAKLRDRANLVLVAGHREDIRELRSGARRVLTRLLFDIDRYDLYGQVAYPKTHAPEDIPELYRLAAATKGVFVNPALTEPFGLTLIEAAASGLPVVATNDGGPLEIIQHCRNGVLIDPSDTRQMGRAILDALEDENRWRQWSKNGVKGASKHYSWSSHVREYIRTVSKLTQKPQRKSEVRKPLNPLSKVDRMLIADIDGTLIGDRKALSELLRKIAASEGRVGFGVASGRRIESAVEVLNKWDVSPPHLFITSVGTEIYYGERLIEDAAWRRLLEYRWEPQRVLEAMAQLPGLTLQAEPEQRRYKVSYNLNAKAAPSRRKIVSHLRAHGLQVKVIHSHGAYLDVLPIRASKGLAVRYVGYKWGTSPDRMLVAGDSGNDEEMLVGSTLGVVVGNHSPELKKLRGKPRVYFAGRHHAGGILEGGEYYDFWGKIRDPQQP